MVSNYIFKSSKPLSTTNTLCVSVSGTNLIYNYPAQISCTQTTNAQTVIVTFENDMQQKKTANVTIPVIYGTEIRKL